MEPLEPDVITTQAKELSAVERQKLDEQNKRGLVPEYKANKLEIDAQRTGIYSTSEMRLVSLRTATGQRVSSRSCWTRRSSTRNEHFSKWDAVWATWYSRCWKNKPAKRDVSAIADSSSTRAISHREQWNSCAPILCTIPARYLPFSVISQRNRCMTTSLPAAWTFAR
uniref:RE61396p n=1 Tax=Drosophila melanogaster TaxID=7227 RepID=Q8MYW7_DROME|nr:RE61396p [Drosophila melanogaster]